MSGYYLSSFVEYANDPQFSTNGDSNSGSSTANVDVPRVIRQLQVLQSTVATLQTTVSTLSNTITNHTHSEFATTADDIAPADHTHSYDDVIYTPEVGDPMNLTESFAQVNLDITNAVSQTESLFNTLFSVVSPISPGDDNPGHTSIVDNDAWWNNLSATTIQTGVQVTNAGGTETPAQYKVHYQLTEPGMYLVDLSFRVRSAQSVTEWRVRPLISQSTPSVTHLEGDWVGELLETPDTAMEGLGLVSTEYFEVTQAMIDTGGAYVVSEMSYEWESNAINVGSGAIVVVHMCKCYLFRPAVSA